MIRDTQIYISRDILRGLAAAAVVLELPNAEAVAEAWLVERLATMPEVDDRAKRRASAIAKADREWKAQWGIGKTEPITQ